MAKAKAARESFIIEYFRKPTLEIKWLSDFPFEILREQIKGWLKEASFIDRDEREELIAACTASSCTSEELNAAIRDYEEKLSTCSFHSQTAEQVCEHLRTHLPLALRDLLEYMVTEAYDFVSNDFDQKCRFPEHRNIHLAEDTNIIETLELMQKQQLANRLKFPQRERRGGKSRIVRKPDQIITLAKEYDKLRTQKNYGDARDKTLWEIVCYRFDTEDPKWRERAKIDCDDIPDQVLDLVSQRVKLRLKPSHLALYHAATRAGICFAVSKHGRTGEPFVNPSPSTLQRCCAEGASRILKRRRGRALRAKRPT